MSLPLTRRQLIGATAASLVPAPALGIKPRDLRVVHMTDFHVQPELGAAKGMELALRHAMNLRPKPELILVGGDLVMDAWSATQERAKIQYDLYSRILKENVDIPVHTAIGNHDLWGIDRAKSGTTGGEVLWGKHWFLEALGYDRTFHSFDFGGWHFVVLDNVLVTPDGYNGVVDSEQLDWLKQDLTSTGKPIVLVSHIPLLSVTGLVTGYDVKTGEWNVGGDIMTKNVDALRALFAERPQVKLCLSGHVHMVDRVDYAGVSYLCGGAVCGNWWKGWNQGFPPGYRVLDLKADGSFDHRYVDWGWHEGL